MERRLGDCGVVSGAVGMAVWLEVCGELEQEIPGAVGISVGMAESL